MSYNLFTPCDFYLPMKIAMREEEQRALDLLVHIVDPEIVVETGTYFGGSAWILSQHVPVVSFDHRPQMDRTLFEGRPVTFVEGHSPDHLDRMLPYLQGKRWLFFHDSLHYKNHLLAELAWARGHGAIAAAWHDAALNEGWHGPEHAMLKALEALKESGFRARRMQHFGHDEVMMGQVPEPECWTGLGLCWFK